jgi:hypothetical protein
MPEFAPKAFYRQGPTVSAKQAPYDTVVRLRNAAGAVIDELGVIAGEWVLIENGQARTELPDVFANTYDAVPWADGHFARKGVQELRQPLDEPAGDVFRSMMLRCAADGTLLCSANLPLTSQADALTGAGDKAAARTHMAVLRQIHAHMSATAVFDPSAQSDLHTFNIMATYFDEPETAEERELPGGGLMPEDVPGVVADAARADGIEAPEWILMDDLPVSSVPQFRRMRDHLFSDLTDIPLGMIQANFQPYTEEPTEQAAFVAWLRRTGEHRPLGRHPDMSNVMPGYEFQADRYARDGVEFLIVEDFAMSALYAWPDNAPVPAPRLG